MSNLEFSGCGLKLKLENGYNLFNDAIDQAQTHIPVSPGVSVIKITKQKYWHVLWNSRFFTTLSS